MRRWPSRISLERLELQVAPRRHGALPRVGREAFEPAPGGGALARGEEGVADQRLDPHAASSGSAVAPDRSQFDCLTFSPSANLIVGVRVREAQPFGAARPSGA